MSKSSLAENAKQLFVMYVNDAGNWSGEPLVGGNVSLLGSKEDRGLLTHLKRAGLVTTFVDEGNSWIQFTDAGKAFAAELGLSLTTQDDY